jgi:hypothetical protein
VNIPYYKGTIRWVGLAFAASGSFDSAMFRWRQLDNSGSGYDLWMVDNIKISGDLPSGPGECSGTPPATPPTGPVNTSEYMFDSCISDDLDVDNGKLDDVCGGFGSTTALTFRSSGTRKVRTDYMHMPNGGSVSFLHRLGHEDSRYGCESVDRGEGVVLEVKRGDSLTGHKDDYTVLWSSNSNRSFYMDAMRPVTVAIPASMSYDMLKLRWRQLSNSGRGYDAWMIDSVIISSTDLPSGHLECNELIGPTPASGVCSTSEADYCQYRFSLCSIFSGMDQAGQCACGATFIQCIDDTSCSTTSPYMERVEAVEGKCPTVSGPGPAPAPAVVAAYTPVVLVMKFSNVDTTIVNASVLQDFSCRTLFEAGLAATLGVTSFQVRISEFFVCPNAADLRCAQMGYRRLAASSGTLVLKVEVTPSSDAEQAVLQAATTSATFASSVQTVGSNALSDTMNTEITVGSVTTTNGAGSGSPVSVFSANTGNPFPTEALAIVAAVAAVAAGIALVARTVVRRRKATNEQREGEEQEVEMAPAARRANKFLGVPPAASANHGRDFLGVAPTHQKPLSTFQGYNSRPNANSGATTSAARQQLAAYTKKHYPQVPPKTQTARV